VPDIDWMPPGLYNESGSIFSVLFSEEESAVHHLRRITILLVLVIIFSLFTGCFGHGSTTTTVKVTTKTTAMGTTAKTSGNTVKSSNGSLSISAPDGWRSDNELWAGSDIGLSGWDYYVVVLKKLKSNYATGFTVNDFLTAAHSDFDKLLYNMNWKPSTNVTINNLSGVTVQMNAKNLGNRAAVVYLISVVADTNNFYEIIGWSGSDRGDLDLEKLQDVMNSLQVK
jgi:hypothetical protein